VARTSWSLDPTTRTLRVEIDLPNANGPLRPGMYAYASLSAELSDVLTVPRSAVATEGEVTRGYQSYCFQVEEGKIHRLPVELGPGDGERVEVLRKQVRAGGAWQPFTGTEQIVRGNLTPLRDGQDVRVKD
jgi:multidrug efflux pump subunit AcrA (membrane-fusion protein)